MDRFPGSRWWSFDFHSHTPASTDYRQPATTPEEWLLAYMRAGIDCVAVTDHNSGAWIDRLKETLEGMERADPRHPEFRLLTLFPGVELSVNGGVHLLALFDPSKNSAAVEGLKGAVGYFGVAGDSDGVTRESLESCIRLAREHGAIPIPAHADQPKGLFAQVADHHTLRQILGEISAFELVEPAFGLPESVRAVATGLGRVVGSDGHLPNATGRHTWIKMSRPDIEGLRLALLDGEISVRRDDESGSQETNRRSENILAALHIENAKYRRQSLEVRLSPWFNAVIGGRGTGKSTLVESIRLALHRERDLDEQGLDELKKGLERFKKVARNGDEDGVYTDDTVLAVEYLKDEARFRMEWRPGGSPPLLTEWNGSDWEPAGEVDAGRFPVRIYSQKQVFQMANRPASLLHLMDEDPSVDRRSWQTAWDAEQAEFLRLRAEYRRLGSNLNEKPRIEGELKDVQRKLHFFERSRHAEVFKAYQHAQRGEEVVSRHFGRLSTVVAGWREALGTAEETLFAFDPSGRFDPADPVQKELLDLLATLGSDLERDHAQLRELLKAMQERLESCSARVAQLPWQATNRRSLESYERFKREMEEQKLGDPSQFGQLVQQRQVLESRLSELVTIEKRRSELKQAFKASYAQLKSLRDDLTARRRAFVAEVLSHNDHIRVELVPFGDIRDAERGFRRLLGREDTNFRADILAEDGKKGCLSDLYVDGKGQSDPDGLPRRLDELKTELARPGESLLLYTTVGKPFRKFLDRTLDSNPETIDRLWCWFPEDDVKVSYRVPGSTDFRPVSQASAGQQTSAILSFLLAYGDEPLILDQPEDDLDNALVYELIVKQIRENKSRRQLIVVTHNPNIVQLNRSLWIFL